MTKELLRLQTEIDAVDDQLIEMLTSRFARSRRIGVIKREEELPSSDPQRIHEQHRRFVTQCVNHGLDSKMAACLIETIIGQVIVERRADSPFF